LQACIEAGAGLALGLRWACVRSEQKRDRDSEREEVLRRELFYIKSSLRLIEYLPYSCIEALLKGGYISGLRAYARCVSVLAELQQQILAGPDGGKQIIP